MVLVVKPVGQMSTYDVTTTVVTVSLGLGTDEADEGEPVAKTVVVEAIVELQLVRGYGITVNVSVMDGAGTVRAAVPMGPEP